MNNKQVSISHGNNKMGAIPSVSLPACITCNPSAPCFKKCYAVRLARRYKTVTAAYNRNLEIWANDPATYWAQVKAAASMTRFFRFHVSGDIPDEIYFLDMINTARQLPNTIFLAFTKQFEIVNRVLNLPEIDLPANMKIIFSNWGAWKCENPHGLPVCEIILKGNEPAPAWKICGGNCTECAARGVGCWELKNGETIAIFEH